LWRTRSCRCLACEMQTGVASSGDTARASACATIPEYRNLQKTGQPELIPFRKPGTEAVCSVSFAGFAGLRGRPGFLQVVAELFLHLLDEFWWSVWAAWSTKNRVSLNLRRFAWRWRKRGQVCGRRARRGRAISCCRTRFAPWTSGSEGAGWTGSPR
jgi:hypothetical protein